MNINKYFSKMLCIVSLGGMFNAQENVFSCVVTRGIVPVKNFGKYELLSIGKENRFFFPGVSGDNYSVEELIHNFLVKDVDLKIAGKFECNHEEYPEENCIINCIKVYKPVEARDIGPDTKGFDYKMLDNEEATEVMKKVGLCDRESENVIRMVDIAILADKLVDFDKSIAEKQYMPEIFEMLKEEDPKAGGIIEKLLNSEKHGEKLIAENNELREQIRQLKNDNQQLKSDGKKLKSKNSSLIRINKELTNSVENSKRECKKVTRTEATFSRKGKNKN